MQTPFLARFAAVSRDLQPGAAQLPRTLPLVNDALQAGVPAFQETPELSRELQQLFGQRRASATTRARCPPCATSAAAST